jgi:hypothetical protein
MPKSLQKTATIDRTPAQVLAWIEDWSNVRNWMGDSLVAIDILSDHSESDPICAGMRFRETRQMGKMKAKAVISVEKHELQGDSAVHEAICDDGCNRWIFDYRFEPTQDGQTIATWTASSAPNKWWTKALNPITAPMMVKMMNKCEGDHLDKLKALIEADA